MHFFEEDVEENWLLGWFQDLGDVFISGKEMLFSFFSLAKTKEPPEENRDEEDSEDETHTRSAMFDI